MPDALRRRRRLTAIARGPPQSPTYWPPPRRHRWPRGRLAPRPGHAAGCSVTATRPVRTSRNSLHHAASRSLTPPGQAIGYNRKRVSSFNWFFGFEFRFWKKFEFNIPIKNLIIILMWVFHISVSEWTYYARHRYRETDRQNKLSTP